MAAANKDRVDRWWIVLVVGRFVMEVLQQGFIKSTGVLLPLLVVQFNTDYATMGTILSLQSTTFYLASPLVRLLSKRFNPRFLATIGGAGIGCSLICTYFATSPKTLGFLFFLAGLFGSAVSQTAYVTMRQRCGDSFASANAVGMFGTVVGGITVPLLAAKLESAYGLRGALLSLGGMFMNYLPVGLVLKAQTGNSEHTTEPHGRENVEAPLDDREKQTFLEKNNSPDDNDETSSCLRIWGNISMALDLHVLWEERIVAFTLIPMKLLLEVVYIGWAMFLVSYGLSVKVDQDLVVYLPVTGAAAGFVSRLVCAILFHYRPNWSLAIYTVNVVLVILALMAYPFSSNFYYLLGCTVVAGAGLYGLCPAYYAILSPVVSDDHFPGIICFVLFATGLASLLAGLVIGMIYDVTGSFPFAFRILGGLMGVVLLLTLLFHYCMTSRTRKMTRQGDGIASASDQMTQKIIEKQTA